MSAPPVRIESKAWTDSRYEALALLLELPDMEAALIRCAKLWRWQTEHYTAEAPTYVVHRSVVIGALKSLRAPEALVEADLAELEPDGRLRIKGGRDDKGKSRIDWLWVDRQKKSAAGTASAAARKAAGDPRTGGKFDALPTSDQQATNTTPTGDQQAPDQEPNSLVSGLRTNDQGSAATPLSLWSADPLSPELPDPDLRARPVPKSDPIAELWAEQDRLRAEVIPGSRPLPLSADRRKRIGRLLKDGYSLDDLHACLGARADEVRRGGDPQWFNGDTNWRPDQVTQALGRIGTSSRGRDGPAGRTAASVLPGLLDHIAELEAAERERRP